MTSLAVRVLIRIHAHRWLSPQILLRLLRRDFVGGRPDTGPDLAAGAVSYQAANGQLFGVDHVVAQAIGNSGRPAPVVLWVHGGGWFFGSRRFVTPYLHELARSGVAGLSLDYPLAPEARHPEPLHALNDGIGQLLARADELGFDRSRVILAGDSAGAALALTLAIATVDPQQAAALALRPSLEPEQLRGVLLCCGVYSPRGIRESDHWFGGTLSASLASLSRQRNWKDTPVARDLDTVANATRALPSTLLISAPDDPLHSNQTEPLAVRLRDLGVDLQEFIASTDEVAGHEFQFDLGKPSAQAALVEVRAFLSATVG